MRHACSRHCWTQTQRIALSILTVLLFDFQLGSSYLGSTPSPDALFQAPELLCVIEHYQLAGPEGARGDILCASESPGIDFLFLASEWYRSVMDLPDCDCDLDFDTYTGCEEILLCINPATNDTDGDCLADNLEIFLGLDPTESDSDGDGTLDRDEDPDGDGRPIADGDHDSDGLTNCQEGTIGTNPLDVDTDDDGFDDGAEILTVTLQPLSDPLDPLSTPDLFFFGAQQVRINLPGNGGDLPVATNMASPRTIVFIPGARGDLPPATQVGPPPVTIEIENQP